MNDSAEKSAGAMVCDLETGYCAPADGAAAAGGLKMVELLQPLPATSDAGDEQAAATDDRSEQPN